MKILIIEDEKKLAHAVKKGLEQESFAVDTAFDGLTGYDLAFSEDYDLIILDLMLPGLDGIKICQKLRQNAIATPILMLTAKGQIPDKVNGLNVGADDYMVKPFAFEELLARIKALSRRPRLALGTILMSGDLTLDTITYHVERNGNNIELSAKEYALLEYLMRNHGRIITKQQIIDHVWNFDAEVLPNTVEVYIGYLRNKIDKPFKDSPPLISTIRGFGYRIGEAQ